MLSSYKHLDKGYNVGQIYIEMQKILKHPWRFVLASDLTAHMSRSSWVGLNDINREGTFVWTDGTQAVSDQLLNFTWINIFDHTKWESSWWWTIFWILSLKNEQQFCIQLFKALFCSMSSMWGSLFVHSGLCRTYFPGRRTSRITGRIMKTVFTFVGLSTRTQENSTTCPAHPLTPLSARKVGTFWAFPVWSVFY